MKTTATALCAGLAFTVLLLGSGGESYQAWAQGVEGVKVNLEPYGKDLSDGSIGGVFPLGENRYYLDDAQGRSGNRNVYFRLTYDLAENEITVIFDQIGTNSPPANTLEVGATIKLTGASFSSGATETTVKGFQFNWNPRPGPIRKTLSIVLDEPILTAPEVSESERIQAWREQNSPSSGTSSSSATLAAVQVRPMSYYENQAVYQLPRPEKKIMVCKYGNFLSLGVDQSGSQTSFLVQGLLWQQSFSFLPLGIKTDVLTFFYSQKKDSLRWNNWRLDGVNVYLTLQPILKTRIFQMNLGVGGSPYSWREISAKSVHAPGDTARYIDSKGAPIFDGHLEFAFQIDSKSKLRESSPDSTIAASAFFTKSTTSVEGPNFTFRIGYRAEGGKTLGYFGQDFNGFNGFYVMGTFAILGGLDQILGLNPREQQRYLAAIQQRAVELRDADIKTAQERSEPCDLSVAVTFDDGQSYFPDGFLESTESALFHVMVKNSGSGPGYETKLTAQLLDIPKGITLDRSEVMVGDVPGKGGSLDCSVGISADASMMGYKARILFRAVEKRGFNSRDYIIELPLRPVALPTLVVVGNFTIQDGTDGYAAGNKNGLIENGETVEINGLVKNQGKGPASGVQAALSNLPLGVEGLTAPLDLGVVEPNQTVPVRFAIHVPADFKLDSGKNLSGLITLTEARNLNFPPSQQSFPFAYRTTRLTASFDQSQTMENGNTYALTLHVTNTAELPARDVTVRLSAANGVTVDPVSFKLTQLTQQAPTSNTINVTIPRRYAQSELNLTVNLEQATFGALGYPFKFRVRNTAPKIEVTPQVVGDFTVAFMQAYQLHVDLYNKGDQTARGLNVTAVISNGIYNQTKSERVGDLNSASGKRVTLTFPVIPRNAKGNAVVDKISIPIQVTVTEQDFPIEPKTASLNVIDDAAIVEVLQAEKPVPMFTGGIAMPGGGAPTGPVAVALGGPVDVPVTSGMNNTNALAIILGVEMYEKTNEATFAKNDASVFRDYARKTLGIPEENIIYQTNDEVRLSNLKILFGENGMLTRQEDPRLDVFVYYAGHGGSDLATNAHYLIPADGDPLYLSSCYNVDDLISQLDRLNVHSVTLFLDACFSGVSRENVVLASAGAPSQRPSGVAATKLAAGSNKVTVFSAANGSQPSNSYPAQEHGLFTFCLLQGLRGAADADGDRQITVGELGQYVEKNMSNLTLKLKLSQTPQIQIKDQQRVVVDFK